MAYNHIADVRVCHFFKPLLACWKMLNGMPSSYPSMIGEDVYIDGDIYTDSDIVLIGKVTGDLNCRRLFLAQTGSIGGSVMAQHHININFISEVS